MIVLHVCKGKIFLSILINGTCHLCTLVDHWHAPHNTLEHIHAKILVSALELQVSRVDTYGEVVNHRLKLNNTSS